MSAFLKKLLGNRTVNAPTMEAPNNYNDIGFTGELRLGMWVSHRADNRVGLVSGTQGKYVVVDWTNEVGETIATEAVQGATLQQARYSQIPEARRPAQSACLHLGYFN